MTTRKVHKGYPVQQTKKHEDKLQYSTGIIPKDLNIATEEWPRWNAN